MGMPAHENSNSVGLTIAETIAEKEGVDPSKLEPLYLTLDTDALESLIEGGSSQDLRIEFEYSGYTVTVDEGGQVDANRLP